MTSNMKLILSAVGAVALLSSPALARTEHHPRHAAVIVAAPTIFPTTRQFITPYAPNLPQPAHGHSGDFQIPNY